jgi:hypothetical protein
MLAQIEEMLNFKLQKIDLKNMIHETFEGASIAENY